MLSSCYYNLEGEGEQQARALHLQHQDSPGYSDRVIFLQHLQVQVHAECRAGLHSQARVLVLGLLIDWERGQDVDSDAICIRFVGLPAHYFDFEGKVDIGTVFEWYLHGAFARNLDDLGQRSLVLKLLEADNLWDFPSTEDGQDKRGQLVDLYLQGGGDVGGDFQLGHVSLDEEGHGLCIFDGDVHSLYLFPVFDGLDGEYLLEVVFLAAVKRLYLDFHFEEMELFLLILFKIVQELDEERELLGGGGEDGVLAEVDFVFVEFQALAGVEDGEGLRGFLLGLIFHYFIINFIWISMSAQLQANRKKLEEMRAIRLRRQQGNTSEVTQSQSSQLRIQKKEHSLQKSQHIHVAGTLTETYDMEIQCALETRSLDSRPAKEKEEDEKEIDLLLPRQLKQKKRDDAKKDDVPKEIHEMQGEELNAVVKSRNFNDFLNRSSKFMEKVMDHGDGDMIEMLLNEGLKSRDRSGQDILSKSLTFSDPNYTTNRVITSIDWSPQINELFLASYSQNEEGSIKDHVGLVLLWNPSLRTRAEFYCFCQSAVTSAAFYPFSNSTVLGGCYNGQILLWDIRAKSMPVQRSGISADSHKYPVCGLDVIGTQIANNIVSYSNDGMMCMWDIKQFSKPTRTNKLAAYRPIRQTSKVLPSSVNRSSTMYRGEDSIASKTSSILQKTVKDELHDINITCSGFPAGDANNYYLGSLNGVLYKGSLHNKGNEKMSLFDQHNGPVSGLSVNNPSEFDFLNGLVLTSSYDWTVKLWNPDSKESMRTFQSADDYVYDVAWHPTNPSLFSTVNNDGYLEIYDLTRNVELPIVQEKVSRNGLNKCRWNNDGSAVITGDSAGSMSMYILAEKYRKMDASKYEDLTKYLNQTSDSNE